MDMSIQSISFPLLSIPDDILLRIMGYLAGTNDGDIRYLNLVCQGLNYFFKNNSEAIDRIVARQRILIEQKQTDNIIILNKKFNKWWYNHLKPVSRFGRTLSHVPSTLYNLDMAFIQSNQSGSMQSFKECLQQVEICTSIYYLRYILKLKKRRYTKWDYIDWNEAHINSVDDLIAKWIYKNRKWFSPDDMKQINDYAKSMDYVHVVKIIESIQ
jgi:hypothetical protein